MTAPLASFFVDVTITDSADAARPRRKHCVTVLAVDVKHAEVAGYQIASSLAEASGYRWKVAADSPVIVQPATIAQEPTKDPDPDSPSSDGASAATGAVGDADGPPLIESEADRANRMQEPAPKWTGARDVDGELWRRQAGHDWWTCVDQPVVQGTGRWLWGWYGPLTDASDQVPVGETPQRPKCHEPAPDRPWTLRDGFGAENRPANDD